MGKFNYKRCDHEGLKFQKKTHIWLIPHENDFISAIFYYLHNPIDLTPNEIIILFVKVSAIVTINAMTATEQLREETMEFANFNHIKGLIQNGISTEIIAKSFGWPI